MISKQASTSFVKIIQAVFPEFRSWGMIQDLLIWEENSLWLKQFLNKTWKQFLKQIKTT